MQKICTILMDDPLGRYSKGDIGILLKNDFYKYKYRVQLEKLITTFIFGRKISYRPVFYFQEGEVKCIQK